MRRLRPGRNDAEHDEDKGKHRQPAQVAPTTSPRARGDDHRSHDPVSIPVRTHLAAARCDGRRSSPSAGAYTVERVAALSGVPKSTVHYWARKDIDASHLDAVHCKPGDIALYKPW